jgi:hypothetical protein
MSMWRAGQLRSPTLTVTDASGPDGRRAGPMSTLIRASGPSPSKTTSRTPARVATGRTPSAFARPACRRYRANTRTPLPHISAIEPSALR